jgi:chemotaxis protein MotB
MARKRRPPASENKDRWLISYADFVTLLLALFVVLFASSQPDKRKVQQVAYSVKEALLEGEGVSSGRVGLPGPKVTGVELLPEMEYLEKALAPEIESGRIEVHRETRGLVISLRQAAFFPSGGDEIATSGLDSLEKISTTIRDIPNPVVFEGHTDSVPIRNQKDNQRFRNNWELSTARSIAMLELFTRRYGIPESRFAAAGYAETRPVDSNDSAEGRAHNRRVDMVILSAAK